MPINFQEIRGQVQEMGRQAPGRQTQLKESRQRALEILKSHEGQLDALRWKVEKANTLNPRLRCAFPVGESLILPVPEPDMEKSLVILAADGSQIYPSRHDRVEFGLINVGAIRIVPGGGETPQETIHSELLYDESLNSQDGQLTEGALALLRDVRERAILAELAEGENLPVVALTDGPLEPFFEPQENSSFKDLFKDFVTTLRRLLAHNVSAAGYVDKPHSDLVVRLLEVASLPDEDLSRAGKPPRRFPGITDISLFWDLLEPGERSAIFEIRSVMARKFEGELKLHFFYLNVGRAENPYLVRVEVPAWVAERRDLLEMLHSTLLKQCRLLGSKPYPYALHRSHEVAVVTFDEKRQLLNMIEVEMLRNGALMSGPSAKQSAKDASKRK